MSYRLRPVDAHETKKFCQRAGYIGEHELWSKLAGINGSVHDCIEKYLGDLGYTGTVQDKLQLFYSDQLSKNGHIRDLAREWLGTTLAAAATCLEAEDGTTLLAEDGTKLEIE